MQHRAQSLIRTAPIGIECLRDLLEPYVRLMKRFVEHFEAGQTHDATFGNWIGCRGRRTVRRLLSKLLRAAARCGLDRHQFTEYSGIVRVPTHFENAEITKTGMERSGALPISQRLRTN